MLYVLIHRSLQLIKYPVVYIEVVYSLNYLLLLGYAALKNVFEVLFDHFGPELSHPDVVLVDEVLVLDWHACLLGGQLKPLSLLVVGGSVVLELLLVARLDLVFPVLVGLRFGVLIHIGNQVVLVLHASEVLSQLGSVVLFALDRVFRGEVVFGYEGKQLLVGKDILDLHLVDIVFEIYGSEFTLLVHFFALLAYFFLHQ